MPVLKRRVAALLAVAAFGWANGASAQSMSADVRRQAERRMARGVELRGAGRDEEALTELRASYQLNPEPRAAAQLALVHQALGQWLEADRLLREALAAGSDGWVHRNRAALDGAMEAVRQHVGRLEVRGGPVGAEVYLAGERVGALPLASAVRVLAGVVTLEGKSSLRPVVT